MALMPLGHVLNEREAALAGLWKAPAAEDRYAAANFELSLRELLCDAAAQNCRGSG